MGGGGGGGGDISKAKGLDGIGPCILKYCALAVYEPLFHLFQVSIVKHKLPAEWKLHGITPIFKSGDRGSMGGGGGGSLNKAPPPPPPPHWIEEALCSRRIG